MTVARKRKILNLSGKRRMEQELVNNCNNEDSCVVLILYYKILSWEFSAKNKEGSGNNKGTKQTAFSILQEE